MFNYKMSENPLEFGMVCVVVKLALCYVFQRVLFFVVYEGCSGESGCWSSGGEVMDLLVVKEEVG